MRLFTEQGDTPPPDPPRNSKAVDLFLLAKCLIADLYSSKSQGSLVLGAWPRGHQDALHDTALIPCPQHELNIKYGWLGVFSDFTLRSSFLSPRWML